eukprot:1155502-Pelagomonas_calceolata.AAC.7
MTTHFLDTHTHPGCHTKAIWLLTTGAREAAFRNIKTIAECLADELTNAAKGSSNRSVQALTSSGAFALHHCKH